MIFRCRNLSSLPESDGSIDCDSVHIATGRRLDPCYEYLGVSVLSSRHRCLGDQTQEMDGSYSMRGSFTRRDIISDAVEFVRSDVLCHGWQGVGLQDVVVLHLHFVLEVAGAWTSVLRKFRS